MADVERLVGVLGRGIVGDPAAAVLAADDLGLTRGDGCFEATRMVRSDDGRVAIDHLGAHLDRLARCAAALDLPDPDRAAWEALIDEACEAWPVAGEAVLRLMLTRGREAAPTAPVTGIVTIAAMPSSVIAERDGIDVVTLSSGRVADAFVDVPWLLGGVKTLSYAVNVAAAREAARRGADDSLFVSTDGYALEAPRSALIWRSGDMIATTTTERTGILASITQQAIFSGARRAGVATESTLIPAAELRGVDGAWLVSSGRLVAPIRHLDGAPLAHDPDWTARLVGWAS